MFRRHDRATLGGDGGPGASAILINRFPTDYRFAVPGTERLGSHARGWALRRQAARLGGIGPDRSGAIALTTALLSTMLLGFAALAIDVSSWESTKSRMQGAADEAALSAGVAFQVGQDLTHEAKAITASAGFVAGEDQVVVTVNQPPLAGNYTTDKTAIEVVISQPATATFSQILLQSPPTVSARAVVAQTGAGACLIVLATSGSSVTMSGSGNSRPLELRLLQRFRQLKRYAAVGHQRD